MINQRMYQPYYCEENVWHLCQAQQFHGWDCRVLFITNPMQCCPLWNQKAAPKPEHPVVWDYHVVVLASPCGDKGTWQIWDSDSRLGSPVPLNEYLEHTFGLGTFLENIPERFRSHFRMVQAQDFIETFSSDRSHMLSPEGEYFHPPPPWPAIDQNGPPNLSQFLDVTTPFLGEILDLLAVAAIDQ